MRNSKILIVSILLTHFRLQTYLNAGNPRNKTALAPGHSLMDWIRLGSSGIDLTGVGGIPRNVTLKELAKHNKRTDAWIAIRGSFKFIDNRCNFYDYAPIFTFLRFRSIDEIIPSFASRTKSRWARMLGDFYVAECKFSRNIILIYFMEKNFNFIFMRIHILLSENLLICKVIPCLYSVTIIFKF